MTESGMNVSVIVENLNTQDLDECLEWKDKLWDMLSQYYVDGNAPTAIVLLGNEASSAYFSVDRLELRRTPVLHGHAVACGLICELYLSNIKAGFPADRMRQTVNFIHYYYPRLAFTCEDYGELIELMTHDKKNADGIIKKFCRSSPSAASSSFTGPLLMLKSSFIMPTTMTTDRKYGM